MLWIVSASAATLTVGPTGDFATLSDAVAGAQPGDILELGPGDYAPPATIGKRLTIRGSDSDLTRLSSGNDTLITLANGAAVTLENLTLDGEAVHRLVTIQLGGILSADGVVFTSGVDPEGIGGGCVRAESVASLLVTNSTFTGCSTSNLGGAIRAFGGATIDLSLTSFDGNMATMSGGAMALDGVEASLTNTAFANNDSGGSGGAIQAVGTGNLFVTQSSFVSNRARVGGAIATNDILVDVASSQFADNIATEDGGAYAGGGQNVTMRTVRFERNTANQGGAVAAFSGDWQLSNLFLCGNESPFGTQALSSWVGVSNMQIDNALFVRNGNGIDAATLEADVPTQIRHVTVVEDLSTQGFRGDAPGLDVYDSVFAGFSHTAVGFNMTTGGTVTNNLLDGPSVGLEVDPSDQILGDAGVMGDTSTCDTAFFVFAGVAERGHFGGPEVDAEFWVADEDGDGALKSVDCDDTDPSIFPGAVDECDGIDTDCDGVVEQPTTVYTDADQDGFGTPGTGRTECTLAVDVALNADDCDDTDPAVNPNAVEACPDLIDNDCDTLIDADDPDYTDQAVLYAFDEDSDGVGISTNTTLACSGEEPPSFVPAINGDDCDDNNPLVSPLVGEFCDGIDNNCDSQVDEGFTTVPYWVDADEDGFGAPGPPELSCETLTGHATNDGDCDDTNPLLNPSVLEQCDGIDNDCDTLVDDGLDHTTVFPDADDDGFGDGQAEPLSTCDPPPGWVEDNTDCDDADPGVNPAVVEVPDDGIDNNCDGDTSSTPLLDSDEDSVPDGIDPDPNSAPDGTSPAPEPSYGYGCSSASAAPFLGSPLSILLLRRRDAAKSRAIQ